LSRLTSNSTLAEIRAAYGWEAGLTDEEVLERLPELNLRRAGQ
jgi:hypothetical protein